MDESRIILVFECLRGDDTSQLDEAQGWLRQVLKASLLLSSIDAELANMRTELKESPWKDQTDAIVDKYLQERLRLKLALTSYDMDIPILASVKTKQSSTIGPRRKQAALVSLGFDDDSQLELSLDLRSTEKLLAAVKEARAEAARALTSIQADKS